MSVRILIGDCTVRLAELPDNSVDSVVCDPPYHLVSQDKRDHRRASPSEKQREKVRATAGFMGMAWDGGDVAFQPETWAEVFRVLKPGGHLVAFSGTRTYHRLATAIEIAGFEVRDLITDLIASDTHVRLFLQSLSEEQQRAFIRCIDESTFGGLLSWAFGSGFPKSHDISKAIDKAAGAEREVVGERLRPDGSTRSAVKGGAPAVALAGGADGTLNTNGAMAPLTAPATDAAREWEGWGTALKPATEPICLARKPLSEKSIAANVLKWGTGALNIDGCRIEGEPVEIGMSLAHRGGKYGAGEGGRGTAETYTNTKGRWPANLCHDGSDAVVAGFPAEAKSGWTNSDTAPSVGAVYGNDKRDRTGPHYADSGSAARFFYTAKASSEERGEYNNHPTVKPISLMRWLVRLVTPKGGTVLDPFSGSGSTLIAADAEQFNAIGCELSPEYAAIAERRIRDAAGMFADVTIDRNAPPATEAA